ncbi:thioredoxin family protein [Maribacter halichondriae]|uniref:thioredoxin family protein n=1 Tax=Maribacter halichondriae TaxID=2980554 RepID=UPI002359EA76|nr:thioredoxin family protein [Maribacter sp. Hal144]
MLKQAFSVMALGFCFLQVTNAQTINQTKVDARGREMLLGKIDKIGLTEGAYALWFNNQHESYKADTELVKSIKSELAKHKITLFMATWCGDSKREVPRFFKILEAADYPMDQLTVVAVDHEKDQYKKSPGGEEKGLNIIKVPTFIFYKDGKAVNRIVESPVESLEKDIKVIITGGTYVPNHSNVPVLPVD